MPDEGVRDDRATERRAARLLDEAATAGLRITDLDGWNQTRLATSLKLRREVVNAIINRDPVAEPSDSRPRMVQACRKIIAFAAVVSRKDDAVVPRPVDASGAPDDDAQAYECHKLRLRRVVEDAVAGGAFIEAMYRVGELSSHAVNAPARFRIKMIGNVVTAIQRLLDKPESRSIPVDVLDHNLRRLTIAEWAARRAVRAIPQAAPQVERAKADDDLAYIRGQAGYAMIFNGLLAGRPRAVRRGRRRLWRAVRLQPSTDCGHWSNLLRATNDLIANRHRPALKWAVSAVRLAEKQRHRGFASAFTRLRDNGELTTLVDFWERKGLMRRVAAVLGRVEGGTPQPQAATTQATTGPARRRRTKGSTAAAILLLVSLLTAPSAARAGDGKELSRRRESTQRVAAPAAAPTYGAGRASFSAAADRYPARLAAPGAHAASQAAPQAASQAACAPQPAGGPRFNSLASPPPRPPVYPQRPQRTPLRPDLAALPQRAASGVAENAAPPQPAAARQRARKPRLALPPALLLAAAAQNRTADRRDDGRIPPPARIGDEPEVAMSHQ